MTFTRRQLAALAAIPAAGAVFAQTPPAAETDLAKAVRENNRQMSETLARFEIPMATEPAFQFKA
jgi:hypothetical protein